MRPAAGAKTACPAIADFASAAGTTSISSPNSASRQKVSRIVVCDTTGGASPEEVTQ